MFDALRTFSLRESDTILVLSALFQPMGFGGLRSEIEQF